MRRRWWRPRSTDDFLDEVRAHIEHEAERQARRSFGGVAAATERFREAQTWCGLSLSRCEALWLDCRYGVRMVARAPGLCAAIAVTLSLGLGVGASLVTVFNGLFLRPNVSHDPSSYVKLFVSASGGDARSVRGEPGAATLEEFDAVRHGTRTLAEVTASAWDTFRVGGPASGHLRGLWVSCNYLRAHVPVVEAGRTLTDGDCVLGHTPVAVLSARGASRMFDATSTLVGRHVALNGRVVAIVGVTGNLAVRDPVAADVYLPYTQRPDTLDAAPPNTRRRDAWLSLSGRYAPGASPRDALVEVQRLVDGVNRPLGRASTARVTKGAAVFDPSAGRHLTLIVSAGVLALSLVLTLTCANVAMLLLARAVAREGEWAMRLRLGASPRRLVRQVMIEGAVVALPAWVLAVGVAWWLPPRLVGRLSVFPLSADLEPDWLVGIVTGVLTIVAGLAAAAAGARHAITAPLAMGAGTATTRSHPWLLAPQVAACVVLATGVSTLSATDRQWRSPAVAYDPADVIVATWNDDARATGASSAVSTSSELIAALGTPGVTETALASPAPFAGNLQTMVRLPSGDAMSTAVRVVSADYFLFARVSVRQGRAFDTTDSRPTTGDMIEAVVSQGLSDRLGGLHPPARIGLHDGRTLTVVGVVADTVSIRPDATDGPLLYLPAGASLTPDMSALMRGNGATVALERSRRSASHPGNEPVVEPLSTILARSARGCRTGRDVLAGVAALAIAVSAIGVAGAMAFQMRRRRRETAVRLALGASRAILFAHEVSTTLPTVAVGVVVGAALSLALRLAFPLPRTELVDGLRDVAWPSSMVATVATLAAAFAALRGSQVASLAAIREE